MKWHYAVWKTAPTMWPACWSPGTVVTTNPEDYKVKHGLTIVRGDVTCQDCLRMMGGT